MRLTIAEKIKLVATAKPCLMEDSKHLCMTDAVEYHKQGRDEDAARRIDHAADYAWGRFNRPAGWVS